MFFLFMKEWEYFIWENDSFNRLIIEIIKSEIFLEIVKIERSYGKTKWIVLKRSKADREAVWNTVFALDNM